MEENEESLADRHSSQKDSIWFMAILAGTLTSQLSASDADAAQEELHGEVLKGSRVASHWNLITR